MVYPSMTVELLRVVLEIGASGKPSLSYAETASLTGLPYNSTIYQIAQLSAGRGGQPGLGLITLSELDVDGKRSLALSEKGRSLVEAFVYSTDMGFERPAGAWPVTGAARALRFASDYSLGTLTVFLEVARLQGKFAFEGLATRSMARNLKINNLPRHLAILAEGRSDRPGRGLIRMIEHPDDDRKKLPEVSEAGHELLGKMISALLNETITTLRSPKPEALHRLDSPENIADLVDEDFWEIEFPVRDTFPHQKKSEL